jgi:DNA processing protein
VLDTEEFKAWFRLLETPGLGRQATRALLRAFGCPAAVLGASPAQWQAVAGRTASQRLAAPPEAVQEERLQTALRWLQAEPAHHAIPLGDPAYPALLLQTEDPPLMLFVQGDLSILSSPSVAVVGSRNPSVQGAEHAREFAAQLAQAGFTVVSGLALGVDGAAHEGALQAQGKTVAVVGTGPDLVYPRRHQGLAQRIAAAGAVVSEFSPGTPPLSAHFPLRNRIIAGLTRGTLVVEAAVQSGSLITARMANEAGREVFAIPGSIHSPLSRGCHALIKQGAKLVESASDILEEWGIAAAIARSEPSPTRLHPLLQALGHDPATLDTLVSRTGLEAATLSAQLLDLELEGLVARLPGGLYQRLVRG